MFYKIVGSYNTPRNPFAKGTQGQSLNTADVYLEGDKVISPNSRGEKVIENAFICKVKGVTRPLPRTRVMSLPTATSFKTVADQHYLAGDVLRVALNYYVLTIPDTTDSTLTYKNTTVNLSASTSTVTEYAKEIVMLLQESVFDTYFFIYAHEDKVILSAKDDNVTQDIIPTGGLGTVGISPTLAGESIGNVIRVTEEEGIVVDANAATIYPGMYIEAEGLEDIIGLLAGQYTFSTDKPADYFALYTFIPALKLPVVTHWDNTMKQFLPLVDARRKW